MNKLKPCPFCGGEAEIIEHEYVGAPNTYGCICMKCNSQSYQFFEQPNKAIEAWNRRVNDGQIQERRSD